ncbi:TolC family protein [Opitutus sp. GAS368]|uniref:TolC family protein n=1 Tax=Opitutus sp. GAS368 TaxID=1882749 RepID=UPI00087CB553|nr:TolC family protein [Opitutus sp. GAS368]SDR67472.1 Outer membrane protein TolC [Opitutus sp. GAS368]
MTILPRRLTAASLAALIACSAAFAQDSAPSTAPAAASAPRLSLEECVARALDKNFAVRIQSFAVQQAQDSVIISKAAYDPLFGSNWQKAVQESPSALFSTTTGLGGAKPQTDNQSTSFSLTQPVITGGTLTANYSLARNASNTVQALINPSYNGLVSLNLSQPLLQGAGVDYNRATIQIAQLGERVANLNLKSSVLTTILNVETAYSNLAFAREQYVVGQDAVKLAQQLLDENLFKRQTGVLTDLDVVQAQAGLATAQSALIGFKRTMENAEDTLLQALGEREFTTPVGHVEFPPVPATAPNFAGSYKLARDNGPNLAVFAATIEQYKLTALRARRNTLPSLNAIAGGSYSSAEHSYGDANSSVWSGPGYNWNVGLAVSVPIGLRAARAQYRQALANVQSEQVAYDQADQNLLVQVRAAVRAVQSSQEGVAAAIQTTLLSQKQNELQKAKFDAGVATSYDVLQAQNQLENARLTQLQAEVGLRNALASLRFLEGTSLDLYRVNLTAK